MPVLEHDVHEKVRIDTAHRYGCHSRIGYSGGYYAPDRRYYGTGGFDVVSALVENRMSKECRYDMSLSDTSCEGCPHRGSGEAYDKRIRSQGS